MCIIITFDGELKVNPSHETLQQLKHLSYGEFSTMQEKKVRYVPGYLCVLLLYTASCLLQKRWPTMRLQ